MKINIFGVKTHILTQKDIDWILINGTGGRNGVLLKLIPLLDDEEASVKDAGAKIAQVIHATPLMQKTSRSASDHCCFEMWMTNKKANMYFWARDKQQLSRVVEQYRVSYPGMDFEETDTYFPLLTPNQYVCVARQQYKKHWVYPLKIIEGGMGWKEILGTVATNQVDQTVIIQIVMKPQKRSKSWKGKMVAVRRKQTTHDPDSPYVNLTNMISSKADQQPFYVEIRLAVMGSNPGLVKRKMENILGAFQRFSSDEGGNVLISVPYNLALRWRVALNAMEDRDIHRFVTPIDHRMQMGSDELGHNFMSIPVDGAEPLQYSHVWKRDIPEEVEKTWVESLGAEKDAVKVPLTIRELTPVEQEEEAKKALEREIEVRKPVKEDEGKTITATADTTTVVAEKKKDEGSGVGDACV